MKDIILNENCLTGLDKIDSGFIDCCVTSPPYFGLRDYGNHEQIGMEATPEEFVEAMVNVFSKIHRVLKDDGTLWLNLGDSYARNGGFAGGKNDRLMNHMEGKQKRMNKVPSTGGLKEKDLIGIPWMVAFALRSTGWYLRQDIIWSKPNPMPESVTDRCTKSHEYIFLFSKSAKYYFDQEAIKTPVKDATIQRLMQNVENQTGLSRVPGKTNGAMKAVGGGVRKFDDPLLKGKALANSTGGFYDNGTIVGNGMANKKSVWTVTTQPFSEAHFATFPEKLIVPCIKAGSRVNGIVIDPFMGSGTTALVAKKLNRHYIGFELNPEYVAIAEKRLHDELGMFK